MGRMLCAAILASLVAGCVAIPHDPERDALGLSVARPAAGESAPDAAVTQQLDWKVSQICTHESGALRQDIEPAEAERQIVDRQLRCGYYDHVRF